MHEKYLNLLGQKHGRLNVFAIIKRPSQKHVYASVCDCGNYSEFTIYNTPRTHSCGCLSKELISKRQKTHGHAGKPGKRSKAYSIWTNMKSRCDNINLDKYCYYGGRGISYSKEWANFENFLSDMGIPEKGMTLERIDVNGNYEKSNCTWASMMDQAKNKRNNLWLEINGEKIHLREASRQYPVKMQTIWARLKIHGWTDRQAVGLDPKPKRSSPSNYIKESIRQEIRDCPLGVMAASRKYGYSRNTIAAIRKEK